ncbi:MAG: AsnC family transcriptional regulator [Bacillota bacterium]|nr:AsnC family transcriptional regulator [Bacillota bacterium]
MSEQDRRLLDLLQRDFPLSPRPYAELGERVGLAEEEVCRRVERWQKSGLVRRLGAVFDSRRLGYRSTLVAASVPPERLDEVVEAINAEPGVTHNYLREPGPYNLWFTLTAPGEEELQAALERIKARTGMSLLSLPATRLFKINVRFEVSG